MNELFVRKELERFLLEDLGRTDVSVGAGSLVEAHIIAEEGGVFCGGRFLLPLLNLLVPAGSDPVRVRYLLPEGTPLADKKLTTVAVIIADAEIVRHGVRAALNLIQHLSGIATNVAKKVSEVEGTGARLLDTRKTTPGFRVFEKYAVRVGGGYNHRFNREDGILIKKEDIVIDGGIIPAIDRAFVSKAHLTEIEIEVETLEELECVLGDGRVTHILLDNMTPEMLRKAVLRCGKTHVLEASGVGGRDVREIAETGVQYISLSSLIRGARPLTMKMRITKVMPAGE